MSGQLIGALILWLIVAIIAIAIVVYLVNWLYRRSSKEAAFVRTGASGGAEQARREAGREVALLIEDRVVGQAVLAVDGPDVAVRQHPE